MTTIFHLARHASTVVEGLRLQTKGVTCQSSQGMTPILIAWDPLTIFIDYVIIARLLSLESRLPRA